MIEKSLMILICMYCLSFSLLTAQFFIGDVLGITLTSWNGTPIRSAVLDFINQDTLNQVTGDIANVNNTRNSTLDAVSESFELGLRIGFDILLLMTGTYIFNLLVLLIGPDAIIFVAGLVAIYGILLGRSIIAYLRGI